MQTTKTMKSNHGAGVLTNATPLAKALVSALSVLLLSIGIGMGATPARAQTEAPAQTQQPGDREPAQSTPALPTPEGPDALDMVNVDLSDVTSRIADNLKVDVSQIPLSVMASVRVAANVCSVEQVLMARRAEGGGASCKADHTTTALDAIVDGLMKR